MSLKLFFNRNGSIVLGMNVLGWALMAWTLYRLPFQWEERGDFTGVAFIVYTVLNILVLGVRVIPWYPAKDRGHGIEEHFSKTMVPAGYMMVVINLLAFIWDKPWPLLVFFSLFLTAVVVANGILLACHFHDDDKTVPSYFSRSLYKVSDIKKASLVSTSVIEKV